LAVIEQSVAEVGRRILLLAQQYMSGEQVARVTARDGEPMWVTFDREYLVGDFDFEVAAGSTQPTNEAYRRQSALQMVDAMAPFVSAGIVDVAKLGAYVLQYGFNIKNPEMFMSQPQQPTAEMMPPQQQPPVPPMPMAQAAPQIAPPLPPEMGPNGQIPPELLAMLMAEGGGQPPLI
jgi:hypothetical protein